MSGVIGLVGLLVLLAGAHLLWQARSELAYWFEMFVRRFRGALRRTESGAGDYGPPESPQGSYRTLRIMAGFGLVFVSQVLFVLEFLF